MDPAAAREGITLLGAALLLPGLGAALAPKGGALHLLLGRLYVAGAIVVGAVACGLSLWSEAWVLAALTGLGAYLAHAGRRALRGLAADVRVGAADVVPLVLVAAGSVAAVGSAAYAASVAGFVPYVPAMGCIGAFLGVLVAAEVVRLRRGRELRGAVLSNHLGMMGASLTLVATLLSPIALTGVLPEMVVWLGPATVAVPALALTVRRARAGAYDRTV